MKKKKNLIIVDIKKIKERFPRSEFPMLEYCKFLINSCEDPNSRLEAWNYERKIPQADWAINNMAEYVANEKELRKLEIRDPRPRIECL